MNQVHKTLILAWTLLMVASLTATADQESAEPAPQDSAEAAPLGGVELATYQVGPGDILEITVWKEPDLLKEVVVPPDGVISFPHAGKIKAEGHTIDQIQTILEERLGKIIVEPIVTVFLASYASNKVYVIGKVNRPGEFPITGQVDVMQALAMAGGMASFADKDSINILRRSNGVLTSIPFDYSEVSDGENLQQNILLEKGDVVVVQ